MPIIQPLAKRLLPNDAGPDFPEEPVDWWGALSGRMQKYGALMPENPKDQASVDKFAGVVSDPAVNPEKYKAKLVPASAERPPPPPGFTLDQPGSAPPP